MLVLSLLFLDSIDIDLLIIFTDFTLQIQPSDTHPFAIIICFERNQLHLYKNILFFAEFIEEREERLLSKAVHD